MRIDSRTGGSKGSEPDIAVDLYGWLNASSPGTYVGAYDGSVGWTSMYLVIVEDGKNYSYNHPSSGFVEIKVFSGVGGDVLGTFDIAFEAMDDPSPTFGATFATTGEFRLLRVSDAYFEPQ